MANLEVPLNMFTYGIYQFSTATTWNRTQYNLNTNNYDGATYYWEVVGYNNTASEAIIELRDGEDTIATITMPSAGTTLTRYRSVSFTPTSGLATYKIYTPAVSNLQIFKSTILIQQVSPTKTRISFPLYLDNYSSVSSDDTSVNNTSLSTTYTQVSDTYNVGHPYFKKDESAFSVIGEGDVWSHECVISTDNSSYTAYACLFDSSGNQINDSEISTTSTSLAIISVDFSNTATNFDDNDLIECKIKVASGGIVKLLRSDLFLYLSSLSKVEVYYVVSNEWRAIGTAENLYQRAYFDSGQFTNYTAYFEATGKESTAGTVDLRLREDAADSGTADSDVTGTTVTFTNTTKERIRTSSITLTDEKRYVTKQTRTSGNITLHGAFIVVAASGYMETPNSMSFSVNGIFLT